MSFKRQINKLWSVMHNKRDVRLAHPFLDVYWYAVLAAMLCGGVGVIAFPTVVVIRVYMQLTPFAKVSHHTMILIILAAILTPVFVGICFGYWRYRWLKTHDKLK